MIMPNFWDDDEMLEVAKGLLAESPDGLKARLLAQAMRLQNEAEEHQHAMATAGSWPPEVAAVANILVKYPGLLEPVRQLIEGKLTELMDSLPEGETSG